MIDIRDYPEVIDAINAVINNRSIAEIKTEKRMEDGRQTVIVVEQSRRIMIRKPV